MGIPEAFQSLLAAAKSDAEAVVRALSLQPEGSLREYLFDVTGDLVGFAAGLGLAELGKAPSVYVLELLDPNDREEAWEAGSQYKALQTRRKKSRQTFRNVAKPNSRNRNSGAGCLYVGKCHGSPVQRMKEHVGLGHHETFALNLGYWSWSRPVPMRFWIARYRGLPVSAVRAMEATLWRDQKPLFGQLSTR